MGFWLLADGLTLRKIILHLELFTDLISHGLVGVQVVTIKLHGLIRDVYFKLWLQNS